MQGTMFVAKCQGQLIIILLKQMRKNRTEFAINMDLVWICVQETVCYFTYLKFFQLSLDLLSVSCSICTDRQPLSVRLKPSSSITVCFCVMLVIHCMLFIALHQLLIQRIMTLIYLTSLY